jgi:hypothetical protein
MSARSFFTTVLAVGFLSTAIFFVIRYQQNAQQQQAITAQNQQVLQTPPIVQKTEAAAPTTPEKTEVLSPDGSMKVIMQKEVKNNANIYSFSVAEVSGNNEHPLFTKTTDISGVMSVPGNSWSPDNKYVFIQDTEGSDVHVLVFKASGESFNTDEQYFDVPDLFAKRETGYTFEEVTGWASGTLLYVRTSGEDSAKGPWYWFEIPSKAFIRLAS